MGHGVQSVMGENTAGSRQGHCRAWNITFGLSPWRLNLYNGKLLKQLLCVKTQPRCMHLFFSFRKTSVAKSTYIYWFVFLRISRLCPYFPHLSPLLPNSPLNVVDQFLSHFGRAQCLAVALQRAGPGLMACACVQILCTQSSISQIRDLISAQPLPALPLQSWESCGFVSFSKGFLISSHAQVYFEIC